MAAYGDTVRTALSALEDDELLARYRTGGLTEEAQEIAKQILAERGKATPNLVGPSTPTPVTGKEGKSSDAAFLANCYGGKASLSDAFWALGAGIWVAIGIPVAILTGLLKDVPLGSTVKILGGCVLLAALLFRDIAIWRCAPNSKSVFWGVAARLWIGLSYGLTAIAAVFR